MAHQNLEASSTSVGPAPEHHGHSSSASSGGAACAGGGRASGYRLGPFQLDGGRRPRRDRGATQHLDRANPIGKSPKHYGVVVLARAASRTSRTREHS
eukprot:1683529-Pyramimonas_sp.AAC.1